MKYARMQIALSVCALVILGAPVIAQESGETAKEDDLDLIDLQVPDSPAFALIGVTPTSITRPTTPKAFALSILGATTGNSNGLPVDFALEYSPFWGSKLSNNTTLRDYYDTDAVHKMFRTLSISIATADASYDTDASMDMPSSEVETTRLALGLRMNLVDSKPSEKIWADGAPGSLIDSLLAIEGEVSRRNLDINIDLQAMLSAISSHGVALSEDFVAEIYKDVGKMQDASNLEALNAQSAAIEDKLLQAFGVTESSDLPSDVSQQWRDIRIASQAAPEMAVEREKIRKELEDAAKERYGVSLQFAAAAGYDVLDNSFDDAEFSRAAAWLTAAYTPKPQEKGSIASQFTFLGLARYLYDDLMDNQNNYDVGGRIIFALDRKKLLPITFSGEYLQRFGDVNDERLVALAEYEISEKLSIYASFGKTFESDFPGVDDVMGIVGLNLGFGKSGIGLE